jgi:hypothetical protein
MGDWVIRRILIEIRAYCLQRYCTVYSEMYLAESSFHFDRSS